MTTPDVNTITVGEVVLRVADISAVQARNIGEYVHGIEEPKRRQTLVWLRTTGFTYPLIVEGDHLTAIHDAMEGEP